MKDSSANLRFGAVNIGVVFQKPRGILVEGFSYRSILLDMFELAGNAFWVLFCGGKVRYPVYVYRSLSFIYR